MPMTIRGLRRRVLALGIAARRSAARGDAIPSPWDDIPPTNRPKKNRPRLKYWAETVTVVCGVAGWLLITAAVAEATRTPAVWKLGVGILLLGVCGFKLFAKVVMEGMLVLSMQSRTPQQPTQQPTPREE